MLPRPLVAALALAACSMTALTCGSAPQEGTCGGTEVQLLTEDTLTVGVDFAFPPFALDDEDGEPTGFEVELLRAITDRLGVDLLLTNRGAATLIPGLLAHRHDLAASGLHNDPELVEDVCASTPYLEADLGLLVPAPDPNAIGGVDGLAGRTVAVLDGSRGEAWAEEHLPESTLAVVPTNEDLVVAIRERRADAVIDDLAFAEFTAGRTPDVAVADEIETSESYVFAAAPDNGALMERIDETLAELEDDGTLHALRRDWFGS